VSLLSPPCRRCPAGALLMFGHLALCVLDIEGGVPGLNQVIASTVSCDLFVQRWCCQAGVCGRTSENRVAIPCGRTTAATGAATNTQPYASAERMLRTVERQRRCNGVTAVRRSCVRDHHSTDRLQSPWHCPTRTGSRTRPLSCPSFVLFSWDRCPVCSDAQDLFRALSVQVHRHSLLGIAFV
jgi:hypothetical protein